jgi:hypothetical protein
MTHPSRLAVALAAFGALCATSATAALLDLGVVPATPAQTVLGGVVQATPAQAVLGALPVDPVQTVVDALRAVAPRSGRGYLVDSVQIDAGQKARLNVVLLDPGPRHCRVVLAIVNGRGHEVRNRGPVYLDSGSATHIQVAGPGNYRAFLRVPERRCESAVRADVEVF